MRYRYVRWLFRSISVFVIAQTIWLEFDWAVAAWSTGTYWFLLIAIFPPVAMIYFFFFIKIRDPDRSVSSPIYRAVRPDVIKYVVLLAGYWLLTRTKIP